MEEEDNKWEWGYLWSDGKLHSEPENKPETSLEEQLQAKIKRAEGAMVILQEYYNIKEAQEIANGRSTNQG